MHVGYKRTLKGVPRAADHPAKKSFVLETLAVWPRAFVVRDFLSSAEIEWLLNRGNATIDTPMNKAAAPQTPREPSTTWLFVAEIDDVIDIVDKRIASVFRIPQNEDIYEVLVVERFLA